MNNNTNNTILLIDDEQHFRDSIRLFLEDCDYQIIEAENGYVGTKKMLEYQPDLVLMDLYMPEMTGLDVLSWAKDNSSETPIIIISGAGVIHDVAEALRLGAWDYIFKPIEDLSILEYAIEKALERAALIKENQNYQSHLEEEVERRTKALQEVNRSLIEKQKRIERASVEEHVLGQLLKLVLQSNDENEFLAKSLETIVQNMSWQEHMTEGALFIKPCDSEVLQLADRVQLSEKHIQQCLDKSFTQQLYQQFKDKSSAQITFQSRSLEHLSICSIPVYLKDSILALLIFHYPETYQVENTDKNFMTRISDILSMGIAKFDAEKEIQFLAYHDALTGLANRCMLLNRLERDIVIAQRHDWFGVLIFVDLDRFKFLNDSLGHLIGDELLIQAAERLQGLVRAEDMIARLGGDEFVILLMEQKESINEVIYNAQNIAQKIGSALSQPYILQEHDYFMTASLGISLFPIEGESSTDLLKHADSAMYKAKAEGGNTSRFYEPSMQKAADERLSIEKDLQKALYKNEMVLFYQPQVLTDGNKIIGAEALLRWKHPQRGWVSPVDFIPIAEETGIILKIGEWVLHSAATQIKQWYEQGLLDETHRIAVNVSPLQLRQASFVDIVKKVISETKLKPSLLKIELTEGTVIDNIQDIISKMQQLKSLGVSFSLDDFGTGYSSLSYLKKLPIDQLKIDRSFVKDITTDENDVAIIETIIAMGSHLGLDVIAEGVETAQEIELLNVRGCRSYQGYFFSQAINASEFEELLKKESYSQAIQSS